MNEKALFLDIDGTVVYDPGYLKDPRQLRFLPGAAAALKRVADLGYLLVFISNKGGAFAKKGLDAAGLENLDLAFRNMMRSVGIPKDRTATYYCPHYLDASGAAGCSCRKPGTALFTRAIADFGIDPASSHCIGDKPSDLIPGEKVGCKTIILVKRNQIRFDCSLRERKRFVSCTAISEAIAHIAAIEEAPAVAVSVSVS